jgi:transposase
MIDYETFCKIRDYHQQPGLKAPQIARELGLDGRTVARWIDEPRYPPKQSTPRPSKLDPYKARIRQGLVLCPSL